MTDDANGPATRRRRHARYKDLAPAVALVTALALLMGGLILRQGYRGDVKIPVTSRAAAGAGTPVEPPPATSTPRPAKIVEPGALAPVAPRSRALASAPQKVAAIECSPPAAASYNVDPTAGDLDGTAVIRERAIYFKHGKKRAAAQGDCRAPALAGNASH